MPPHQRIWGNNGIERQQCFAPHRFSLPRQQRAFVIGKSDALPVKSPFEELILSLEKLDDDQRVTIYPAGRDQ